MTENAKRSRPKASSPRRTRITDPQPRPRAGARGSSLASGEVTPVERHELIAIAAYFRAEQRGFTPGCELHDWLEAEAEIEQNLGIGQA